MHPNTSRWQLEQPYLCKWAIASMADTSPLFECIMIFQSDIFSTKILVRDWHMRYMI